ncbi:MarR family winged helix-turn-helix transcriptional regulator [Alteraurantiacibacter aestuarii]|uniref:MarR family winged helix-turn-helix transcriptional regulator n=1 Tax=Alteraurantiacibacter aestuarii TaxID=650004 RepID=UPI0031D60920
MPEAEARIDSSRKKSPVADLVSIRMVILFNLLRRGSLIGQKRNFDLSEVQWRIMSNLGQHAPLSLNGLAELLILDCGQLSRAVKGMVERGLLTRTRKPGGPEIEIDMTDKGRELYGRMVERAVSRDARLLKGIDPADIAVVSRVISHMIAEAETILEEERELGNS